MTKLLATWALALAAASALSATKHALLVGIDVYADPMWPTLPCCETDCRIMRESLTSCGGGWTANSVTTLVNASATSTGVQDAIAAFAARAESGDTFVFYHSGHGESGSLRCHDAAMSAASLGAALRAFKGGVKVLCVIDACYSGSLPNKGRRRAVGLSSFVAEVGSAVDRLNVRRKGAVPNISSSDIGWCTASSAVQESFAGDVTQGSYFTYAFASSVKSGAADAVCFSFDGADTSVGNGDGDVTATEAFLAAYKALENYGYLGNFEGGNEWEMQIPQIFNGAVCDGIVLSQSGLVPLAEAADAKLPFDSYAFDSLGEKVVAGGGWLGQTRVSRDGKSALACSPPLPFQGSVLRTTVTGPGTLSFSWKTSCFEIDTGLDFRIDGDVQDCIAGADGEWAAFQAEIGSGSHELKWTYRRDSEIMSGENCGWVDQISWTAALVTVAFDANGGTFSNGRAIKYVEAKPGNLWGKLPMPARSGYVFDGYYAAEGGEPVTASCQVPSAAATYHARWTPRLGLAEGSEWPYAFATDCWCGQGAVTHDGRDALRSGIVYNGQNAYLQTKVTGEGTLTFWWKVSCEGGGRDALRFLVDGTQRHVISGEVGWTKVSVPIEGAGAHTLKWNYTKDASVTKGEDFGWLDQISWTGKQL